jgi:hypothetical protein
MLDQGWLTVNVGVAKRGSYKNNTAPASFAAGADRGIAQLNPLLSKPTRGRIRPQSSQMLRG